MKKQPNILYITTDQQHAGMLGCASDQTVLTPNLDKIARSGIRFENAYCTNPVCIPSRYSLVTGQYPSTIGMEANEDEDNPVQQEILDHSIGSILKKAGYECAYGGKVHLPGRDGIRNDVSQYGFEAISKDENDALAKSCAEFITRPHDKPFFLAASFINPHDICFMAIFDYYKNVKSRDMSTTYRREYEYLSEALELPEGMSEEEFFANVCPELPENYEVPEKELTAFMVEKPDFMHYARNNWDEKMWRLHRWAYKRLTERMDGQVGVLLEALNQSGHIDDTVILFTSDHGDQDGAHRVEHKAFLYQESINIPLIWSYKGVFPENQVDREHLVCNGLDILPTICSLAGTQVPEGLPGRDLTPLLKGQKVDDWRNHLIIENHMARLVHMGNIKYMAGRRTRHTDEECPHCKMYTRQEPASPNLEMLIDLDNDPGEMINRVEDPLMQEHLMKGRRLLRSFMEQNLYAYDENYLY
jgi:choline-sulfatase